MPVLASGVKYVIWVIWPACVGALAVLYASAGDGAWARRSAIAWMMGSWGARLTVQALYARQRDVPVLTSSFTFLTSAAFFSLPALIASRNPDPSLTTIELSACALWVIAFAGETTADRQFLRFTSKRENAALTCRSGLWRYSPHAHAILETLIWVAFALFASASVWGWIAFACPVVMASALAGRGNPSARTGTGRALLQRLWNPLPVGPS